MKNESEEKVHTSSKLGWREFFSLGEVGGYFFRRRDKNANVNVRIMHGINKFSIIVFLAAVVYMIIKHLL